jgi:hypothetical protein
MTELTPTWPDGGQGFTTGIVFAIEAPDRFQLSTVIFRVADPVLLRGLVVGVRRQPQP